MKVLSFHNLLILDPPIQMSSQTLHAWLNGRSSAYLFNHAWWDGSKLSTVSLTCLQHTAKFSELHILHDLCSSVVDKYYAINITIYKPVANISFSDYNYALSVVDFAMHVHVVRVCPICFKYIALCFFKWTTKTLPQLR